MTSSGCIMSNYDEDLTENPIFNKLISYITSFEEIVVLLVPKIKSISTNILPPNEEDLRAHIIVQKSEDILENLNGQKVVISENEVKFEREGLGIPVLFKETHYGQDWEKVKVLCIQRPVSNKAFENEDILDGEEGNIMNEIFLNTV